MNTLCKKTSNKLNALSRQCKILPFQKRRLLMNAFVTSQFNYCPLIWMCHNRSINHRINNLHYRALRIVYNDDVSSFQDLLKKDGSVTIHHQNIRYLVTEMYKVHNNYAPSFMRNLFEIHPNLQTDTVSSNTRSTSYFYNSENPRTSKYGLNSLRCLGPKLYDMVPEEIKRSLSLSIFKEKISRWIPEKCPCKLCRNFIQNLGYIT